VPLKDADGKQYGCLWQFDFYACDDPGFHNGGMQSWDQNCVRNPPLGPVVKSGADLGYAGGTSWSGKKWFRNFCTGFGNSPAAALKIAEQWGVIYGFVESANRGPNPYYDQYNAGGCPSVP